MEEAVAALCVRFDKADYNPTPIIALGTLVANADGKIDDDARETLSGLLEELFDEELSAELVEFLIQASLDVIAAAGADARARLIGEILVDCDAVEEGLTVALAVAHASHGLSKAERAVIASIGRVGKVDEARLTVLDAQVMNAIRLSLAAPSDRPPAGPPASR
ncbi:MAG: hypothetical protein NVS3B20_24560 [Polyangiales bacterium]